MSNDRILKKIQKCLALSKSSNEHEAAAALRQAKALMDKHQLSMNDVQLSEIEVVELDRGGIARPPHWKITLYLTVAQAFGCSMFTHGGHPVFVGRSPGPDVAKYALDVLLRQLELNKKDFLKSKADLTKKLSRGDKTKLGRGFCEGWVYGCHQVVEKFSKELSEEKHQEHTKKMEKHFQTEVRTGKQAEASCKTPIGAAAAAFGYQQGQQAQIHAGMTQDSGPELLTTGALI